MCWYTTDVSGSTQYMCCHAVHMIDSFVIFFYILSYLQICGSYPDTMTKCAQLLTETCNVDFIDINCGCPIDLVYKKVNWVLIVGGSSGFILFMFICIIHTFNFQPCITLFFRCFSCFGFIKWNLCFLCTSNHENILAAIADLSSEQH